MMFVLTMTHIFLGVFIKGLLASRRAEVVGLPFILRLSSGGCGINIHATYGIFNCRCHKFIFFFVIMSVNHG